MSNVTPIKISLTNGRLPLKKKGLEMKEFANVAEVRRDQLEKLASSFEDVNYHTVAKPLWAALKNLEADQYDDKLAKNLLKKFNKLCKDELKAH